jgi:hypothetical protein
MKIRSLLLGSIAAAGLTTGAFAADPAQVLTTLDLCDALGLTGLTVSSDNNCLQISGEVKYEFVWGDYRGTEQIAPSVGGYDAFTIPNNDANGARDQDWNSKVEAYFKVVGTADTDVGPAIAVIKMKDIYERRIRNENNFGPNGVANPVYGLTQIYGADGVVGGTGVNADYVVGPGLNGVINTPVNNPATAAGGPNPLVDDVAVDDYNNTTGTAGDDTGGFVMDEAYVAIGGATVLSAGKKGTIMKFDDDVPFNWKGLFLSEKVDVGVKWTKDLLPDGGHVIQLVHDFGNGLSGGIGLENLQDVGAKAGTAVGVLWYAGDTITAHVTVAAGGVLDGTVEAWGVHAGITGTFDILKVRGAFAADNTGYWNALASAEATFDIFKLAVSGEAANGPSTGGLTDFGVGASASVTVTDGVAINLGGRYYSDANGPDGYQVAAEVVADITETIKLSGEVGVFGVNAPPLLVDGTSNTDVYGKVTLAWAPGGGFTSSLAGEVHQNGAYKATFKAGKVID